MFAYLTIGTNDKQRAIAFFEALLSELGAQRAPEFDNDRITIWRRHENEPMFGVAEPWDGKPATPGNGNMLALAADSQQQVDDLHAKALALGGTDEGAPGMRGGSFYSAYFRDLDGNKFVIFKIG